jgi:hypothetical protein
LIGVAMMEARGDQLRRGAGEISAGVGRHGETTKLTSGSRVAVTEGEGIATRLRKLEEEAAFGNYAKAAQAGMGRARVRSPQEEGGAGEGGRAERPDGPTGLWVVLGRK